MTIFDQPAYIKGPEESDDVIMFGKEPAQEAEDLVNGVARFGGLWRSPSYMNAYVRAADILISSAIDRRALDDVGLPSFYLQRHATELLVKRLLGWLHEIAAYKLQSGEDTKGVPTAAQRELRTGSHNLGKLWQDLNVTATHFGFAPPPVQIGELVAELTAFEKTATWARYERSEKKGVVIHHVEHEVAVPLLQIQRRLEEVARLTSYRVGEDDTYEQALYDEWLAYARSAGDAG